jgi:high-affinity iron transporter
VITSFGIALREGIEAALIVGIVLLYLGKTGRRSLASVVYWAVGAAVAVSVALAVSFEAMGLDVENPYFEGIVLAVTGVLVISTVLWMMRTVKGLRARVERRLESITGRSAGVVATAGLFGFVFFMILREGAELVLFLKAAAVGSQTEVSQVASISRLTGAVLGLVLAILFAVFFVRGSVRVDIRRFFRFTGWALLVLGAKLLLGSLHEFGELGILPAGNAFFEEAGEVTQGLAGDLLVSAIVAVPVILLVWDLTAPWRRRHSAPCEEGRP